MPTITLTFPNPINVSCQIGDIVRYTNPTTVAGFQTSTTIVEIGPVTSIDRVLHKIVATISATTIAPTTSSFILFSKDNAVNNTSILGYYGELQLVNNSPHFAEMFETTAGFFESSK